MGLCRDQRFLFPWLKINIRIVEEKKNIVAMAYSTQYILYEGFS